MFGRRLKVSLAGWLVVLLLILTTAAEAQQRKSKPQLPPGAVTPACQTGCVPPYDVSVTPDGSNAGTKPANTGGYSAVFTVYNRGTNYDEYFMSCG